MDFIRRKFEEQKHWAPLPWPPPPPDAVPPLMTSLPVLDVGNFIWFSDRSCNQIESICNLNCDSGRSSNQIVPSSNWNWDLDRLPSYIPSHSHWNLEPNHLISQGEPVNDSSVNTYQEINGCSLKTNSNKTRNEFGSSLIRDLNTDPIVRIGALWGLAVDDSVSPLSPPPVEHPTRDERDSLRSSRNAECSICLNVEPTKKQEKAGILREDVLFGFHGYTCKECGFFMPSKPVCEGSNFLWSPRGQTSGEGDEAFPTEYQPIFTGCTEREVHGRRLTISWAEKLFPNTSDTYAEL